MNLNSLRSCEGTEYLLRPTPRRRATTPAPDEFIEVDEPWVLTAVLDAPTRLVLTNTRARAHIEIYHDGVREFRHPNFLLLRVQITEIGSSFRVEPIVVSEGSTPIGLSNLLADIENAPLIAKAVLRSSAVGVLVRAEGKLATIAPVSDSQVRFGVIYEPSRELETSLFCLVKRAKYPRLETVRKGSTITVEGRVATIDALSIFLEEAKLISIG